MLTAITGINWGDEGKGRMVDLLSQEYDIVCRYQGGNNAGHTVVNPRGKFVLNLLPSGILRPDVVCVMGNGMVVDPAHLEKEIANLRAKGIEISPKNLKISDRATICMPYHVAEDGLEEDRLAKSGSQFGSTRRGIAYSYGDKYMKKTLRMGDLVHLDEAVKKRLATIVEWKNLTMEGIYGTQPISLEETWAWCQHYAEVFKDYICDVGDYLTEADKNGKKILFEAQLGALRDIDFGIYPFTSSSNVIGAYAPIGAGIPGRKLDLSVGIMKAYSSCVGEGPFTAELAMTLLDVLDYMEKIPVVAHYSVNGQIVDRFPMGEALDIAQPVLEYLPGWHCDITAARKWEDLPKEAQDYVGYIEKAVGCRIAYISVGPDRDACIRR